MRDTLHQLAGLVLYLLTLAVEVLLGASMRWLLAYLAAASAGGFVASMPSPALAASGSALAPLVWSLLGLVLPTRGAAWRRRLGGRHPSAHEIEALDDAMSLLRAADPTVPPPESWFVVDDPQVSAAVRGRATVLSRGLIDSEALACILAHELGHTDSLDGRLTEALNRMVLWGDPLAPPPPPDEGDPGFKPPRGVLVRALRWILRLAGGSIAHQLLAPLWAAHWRSREFAADAYAASLGQGEDLARYLGEQEMPFDGPVPHLLFSPALHPPIAHRVERLSSQG
jgi:Zn-dependent protease with chaperone function